MTFGLSVSPLVFAARSGLLTRPVQVLIDARHGDRVIRWPGAAIDRERALSALRCLGEFLIQRSDEFAAANRKEEFL